VRASPASEIPALLKLLDDEHPTVRAAVKKRLAALGPDFEGLLCQYAPEEAASLIPQAVKLRREFLREEFWRSWETWRQLSSSVAKLEQGLTLLSDHLSGTVLDIGGSLDALAAEFREIDPAGDARDLAAYLFASGRFSGNEGNYYAPGNSNLARVLADGQGNPILLACVMILVGDRVGLEVGGCNFPSHFLARYEDPEDGALYLIDCFNGGKVFSADTLIRHQPIDFPEVEAVVRLPASAEVIISRVLRNLDHAFERAGQPEEQGFMGELWQSMAAS